MIKLADPKSRSARRAVCRRKLRAIARVCCDPGTTDALDRAIARGPVSVATVRRLSRTCTDHDTTDALDVLATGARGVL